jgi:ABC-type lipoprotein export system ATPase subunit
MNFGLFGKNRATQSLSQSTEDSAFVEQIPFIHMRQIVKTFNTPVGDFQALKGIDVDFRRGEFVSIVGKSGSGKSTLVNMITGIDHPTSGTVLIGDTYVHGPKGALNESQMARWRGRNLGIVFQFYQLLPTLSLIENVMLPMDICDCYPYTERPKRAIELLDRVGLADIADKMPAAVSGGQQQSAAIARALANDPPLIVADEPTGNLDSRAADHIFRTFEDLAKQGKTILVVTHDPDLAQRAFRTVLLADGEVIHESVANTLPLLSHEQMLKATKNLQPRHFDPGETILHQGQHNDHFYIIAQGQTEVLLHAADGNQVPVARLGPGQYFGEMSLLDQSRANASVKATPDEPVKTFSLERGIFTELMNEAQAMREALMRVVHDRLTQNAALITGWGDQGTYRIGPRLRGGLHAQTSLA